MKLNIALLPGDGIGPEVIEQAVKVSDAIAKKFNHDINWIHALTGAAAIDLALVASGKTDAFWQRNLKIWDISSGVLLVREAGGKVTQPSGDKWTIEKSDILVSNNFIHNQFLEELNSK